MTGTPEMAATDAQADLPVQMQVRREKRERILASGREAYPGANIRETILFPPVRPES